MALTRPKAEIENLLQAAVAARGYELWGWEYLPQGKHSVLRVYIEHPEGVSIDDCQAASQQVGAVLDVEEGISGQYSLEVSSPGMDRHLFKPEQYQQYVGETVKVKLQQPLADGRHQLAGKIVAADDENLTVEIEDETVAVPFLQIVKGQLVPTFAAKGRKK